MFSENSVRAWGPTIETSSLAALHERGNICPSCLKPHGDSGGSSDGESSGSEHGGELQPFNSHGSHEPAADQTDTTVLGLYKQAEKNPANFVATGHSKFWRTTVSERQVYSTGVCYGCTVVVVASGKGVYLRHFAEDAGTSKVFADPANEIFVQKVSGPFEDEISENNAAFEGQRPHMVVATPYASSRGNALKYRSAVDELGEFFNGKYTASTLRIQGYQAKMITDEEALLETTAGKIVVEWLPPSDGGDARLIVHVEDNIVVDAHYNADGTLV